VADVVVVVTVVVVVVIVVVAVVIVVVVVVVFRVVTTGIRPPTSSPLCPWTLQQCSQPFWQQFFSSCDMSLTFIMMRIPG